MTNAFTRTPLWGTLFQDPYTAGEFSADSFCARMVQFEMAWTRALRESGAIEPDIAEMALAEITGFQPDPDALADASDVDGLPVPALVRQLRSSLPEDARVAVHSGATSQDVIDTAMVLTALAILSTFEGRCAELLRLLDDLNARFSDNPVSGRTRMQLALPIAAGDRIQSWRTPLAAHLGQLPELINAISVVQVGGAVGRRDLPNGAADAIAAGVAKSLGLRVSPVWHTDRSLMLDIGHWLTKVSGTLGKLGQDIALMAQQGIDEVQLDGAGGSSAMPHKQNPVRAELLIALARVVAGQQGILAQSMVHEQERSGASWAIEWMTLPAMFEATGAALNSADHLLKQIRHIGQRPAD
ncbi:3-carboxy-cis,cis-muconate cycloisomerase [Sedimentitalea todarodis]|uniref:3-carboxy-cis,cis-muconate cycloisomerase n=1 Tax=Sedimentitalea todarodis TaxID=1631240 RepID=A0ABU3VEH4_9RHOB|nr:3-carboxy-cis,cis-muconate cycloisomerase [Sedimentitalea todarodis]MDU9004575.1 3-carboxy-cis,cis-muconate cycloisomerase [Sedimentitalea todarodis]